MNEGDTLTGAHGRVAKALRHAWARGMSDSRPLALLLTAFDGDEKNPTAEATALLARVMGVHCARAHDTVLQRGPGEFAALLPDTAPAGARRVAEQIVEAMRGEESHRTISVGIAVSVPDELHEPSALLRRAHDALHVARERGGDRCAGGAFSSIPGDHRGSDFLPWCRGLLGPSPADRRIFPR